MKNMIASGVRLKTSSVGTLPKDTSHSSSGWKNRVEVFAMAGWLSLSSVGVAQNAIQDGVDEPMEAPTRYERTQQTGTEVAEIGPHHITWETIESFVGEGGTTLYLTNRFHELANGVGYYSQGQWIPSEEKIEVVGDHAVARRGLHQVIFAPDAATEGCIDYRAPDGKRFRSHFIGIGYTDVKTGASVQIGTLQNSTGELVGDNQVVYPDVCKEFACDLVYIFRRGSFEQDLVLQELPPPPEAFDLNSDSTLLEIFSEFVEVPEGSFEAVQVLPEPALQAGRAALPELEDHQLDFGSVRFGNGRAFPVSADRNDAGSAQVLKRWEVREGRHFLIERLPHRELLKHQAAMKKSKKQGQDTLVARAGAIGKSPTTVTTTAKWVPSRMESVKVGVQTQRWKRRAEMAAMDGAAKGYCMDYVTLVTAANQRLRASETYYVNSAVILSGTTVAEPGVVIKFNSGAGKKLEFSGPVVFGGSAYRPIICTSAFDNSVGDQVFAGSASGKTYGYPALHLNGANQSYNLRHLSVRLANEAIRLDNGSNLQLWHSQLVNCAVGINKQSTSTGASLTLNNVLMDDVTTGFTGSNLATSSGEQVTVHRCGTFSTGPTLALKNSLLMAVTNGLNYTPLGQAHVVQSTLDAGVFQSAVAGAHYLPRTSPYRGKGITLANTALASDLKQMTTQAPCVMQGTVAVPTIWGRYVERDFGTLDLGYHYLSADYSVSNVVVSSDLVLTNGVVVATHGAVGFKMASTGRLWSFGHPLQMNRLVSYTSIQEQTNQIGLGDGYRGLVGVGAFGYSSAEVRFRFTELGHVASGFSGRYLLYGGNLYGTWVVGAYELKDCRIWNTRTAVAAGSLGMKVGFTNNLFQSCSMVFDKYTISGLQVFDLRLYNNTMTNGDLTLSYGDSALDALWTLRDNVFESVSIVKNVAAGLTIPSDYNGYLGGTAISGSFNRTITTADYDSPGALGDKYVKTTGASGSMFFESVDRGSRSPANATLSHHTLHTSNVKDAGSWVDLGYHYVSVTGSPGNYAAADGDSDGIGDVMEDVNGNNVADAGESPFNSYNSPNGLANPGLVVFTVLK